MFSEVLRILNYMIFELIYRKCLEYIKYRLIVVLGLRVNG